MNDAVTAEKPAQPKQCAWCNRWYDNNGRFVPAPFIAINVSHGICPVCYQTKMDEIKRMRLCATSSEE